MDYIHYNLDNYYRNASFGRDYKVLKGMYEYWGDDLHKKGHVLEAYKLKTIATEGIIRWYCEQINNNIDIDYPLFIRLNQVKNNIKSISYYDWINICKFCDCFNIRRTIFGDYKFNKNTKYEFITEKFPKERDLYYIPMGMILIQKYSEEEIKSFISYIIDELKQLKSYFEQDTIFKTFIKHNQDISDLGISFQRTKILIEKMEVVVCINNISIESTNYNPDIYKYDKFCNDIQECIYSWIKNYFSGFFEKTDPKVIRVTQLPIDYEKVKIYINPVPDDQIYKIRL